MEFIKYKTVDDHPRMGLNNTLCIWPVAFCHLHRVYLSKEDIVKKQCLYKPTIDMIGKEKCKRIEYI